MLRVLLAVPKQGEVNAVTRQFPEAATALALLHSNGQLNWLDPFHYNIEEKAKNQPVTQLHVTKQMQQYLTSKQCR